MVKKILLFSTLLLITILPNINVNAIQVGSLSGLNITQNENGTNVQYSLMNDYFSYTQGTTRFIFSHSDNLMWKGINVYSADEHVYTTNLNYYFSNPCSSSDNVSYNQRIAFFFVNTDQYPLNTLSVVNNINGCSGYWTKEDTTYYYNQSCSLPAGSSILGSLYFSEPSLGSWQVSNYRIGIQDDFDVKCEVNTNALVDNNNANTQNIINNQTNNTDSIINNQNSNTNQIIQDNQQNTQDIINNQNSNTQQEIESQKVCKYIDKKDIVLDRHGLDSSGRLTNTNNYGITDYIPISNTTELKIYIGTGYVNYMCFYNTNKEVTSCLSYSNITPDTTNGTILTIPSGSSYFRAPINYSYNRPTFNLCTNGNQALNDSVNDLNDSITSTESPNTNQDIDDMNDMVASDTPISDLITMPLTLFNAYINGINSSCSPFNIGNLYGTDIVFPCLNLQQRLGSNLWSIIDAFFSIFMCYNIGMLFITAFDGLTSLRDDFEGLYQPRHADTGYQPKHGGGN